MDKNSWRHLAWQNECQGWLELGRHNLGPGAFQVERVGPWVCAWGSGLAGQGPLGHQWLLYEDSEPPTALAKLLPPAHPGRATLRLPPLSDPTPWREALKAAGLHPLGSDVLMACPLGGQTAPALPPGFRIGPTQTALERREALEVVRLVFGDPPGLTEFFSPSGLVEQYALRAYGLVVSAAAIWPFAQVAGIYSVATLPKWRNQGLAHLLLTAMLADAQTRFPLAVLRTYDDLVPMYGRLGFRSVGRSERWSYRGD